MPLYPKKSQTIVYTIMEDCKKQRTAKARLVTRRVNELINAVHCGAAKEEIWEKINNVKHIMNKLGEVQDELWEMIGDTNAESTEKEEKWYNDYDLKANRVRKHDYIYR